MKPNKAGKKATDRLNEANMLKHKKRNENQRIGIMNYMPHFFVSVNGWILLHVLPASAKRTTSSFGGKRKKERHTR